MSVTVGAALKKIAVSILTDKKALKTVGGILLGIIILICLPVAAIVSILNGDIQFDEARLQQIVVQNLSAEEKDRLKAVENTMYAIDNAMTAAGFNAQRVKEAQVLYVLALSDVTEEAEFVDKLVGCFAEGQTDSQLIAAVNTAFGTEIRAEDFSNVMNTIRAVYISTAGYVDPYTKNNLDLVTWAKNAKKKGWGYVWGTYGQVLTKGRYKAKLEQYPDEIGPYSEFIESHWLGTRTADCVGLIKGYGWFDPDTHDIGYAVNGMPDIDADAMYENALEKGTIDTLPEIPGLAVWHEGHIGIYIGDGQVIHASGTMSGVIQTSVEAPIDLLSFLSMERGDWQQNNYAACCGVADRVLFQMLRDNPGIQTVVLCLDNDEVGQAADLRIAEKLKAQGIQTQVLIPIRKDWNEDLVHMREEKVCPVLQF